jgi:hypothetical protein
MHYNLFIYLYIYLFIYFSQLIAWSYECHHRFPDASDFKLGPGPQNHGLCLV